MYTGLSFLKNYNSIYLIDELGYLENFNFFHEKIIDTEELIKSKSPEQTIAILKSHNGQMIGSLSLHNQLDYFFTIVATSKKQINATHNIDNIKNKNSISINTSSKRSVGVLGDVVLWTISKENNSSEFIGHENNVFLVSSPPVFDFNNYNDNNNNYNQKNNNNNNNNNNRDNINNSNDNKNKDNNINNYNDNVKSNNDSKNSRRKRNENKILNDLNNNNNNDYDNNNNNNISINKSKSIQSLNSNNNEIVGLSVYIYYYYYYYYY
jgi:hypothetical protein